MLRGALLVPNKARIAAGADVMTKRLHMARCYSAPPNKPRNFAAGSNQSNWLVSAPTPPILVHIRKAVQSPCCRLSASAGCRQVPFFRHLRFAFANELARCRSVYPEA
jgi:hypothetical protein